MQAGISDHDLTYSAPGTLQFQAVGRFLLVREAAGDIFIQIEGGTELRRQQGETIDIGGKFKRVFVRSTSAQTVRIVSSELEQKDSRANVTGTVDVDLSDVSNGVTSVPDVSCAATSTTQVVTANANNIRAMVTNPEGSGVEMRVGVHVGVGAANGTPLPEGATISISTQLGVWVYNPKASAVAVPVSVETLS
jgi:hypothetical protein